MQRFARILFVNDPIANAVPAFRRAVELARSNEAQLTVANVTREVPSSLNDLQQTYLDLQEEALQSLSENNSVEGVAIKTLQLVGTPFLQIIKEVLRGGHDLVIKPAEGESGVAGMLFGSVDLHLLRKCPCPVWIIKPSKKKKYARILAAVDPDPAEEGNAELNALILDLASSLAFREKSELHVVHAWKMPYEATLRSGRAYLPKSEIDRMVHATRNSHKKWLDGLLAQHDLTNVPTRTHLVKGDPGDVVPTLARKKRVGLIVMGTVARTGIPGFFIGNTAEKTLAAIDCSVLAVKPRAFRTPVAP